MLDLHVWYPQVCGRSPKYFQSNMIGSPCPRIRLQIPVDNPRHPLATASCLRVMSRAKKLSLYLRGKRPGGQKCRTLFHVCLHLTCLVSLCHVSNGCANSQWPKTFALQVGLLPVEGRPSQACTSECHDLEPACTYNICTMLGSVQGKIMKNLSNPFRNHDRATQQAVSVCAEVLSYHTSYHSSSPALSTAPPRGNFEEFRLARPHPWTSLDSSVCLEKSCLVAFQ